jgi:hypothetical protein
MISVLMRYRSRFALLRSGVSTVPTSFRGQRELPEAAVALILSETMDPGSEPI